MEKDKFRSVIAVGMLVCSVLALSALFMGCATKKTTSPQTVVIPQPAPPELIEVTIWPAVPESGWTSVTCTNPNCADRTKTAAFSHHQHGQETYQFARTPAYALPDGTPAPVKCPTDDIDCAADSGKCLTCSTKLF